MIEGGREICWHIYQVRNCTEAGKTSYNLAIEPCPHHLEAGNLNTMPVDVYRCMVANNVSMYLSKLAMELILIALHNCSGA